jgi:anti-anti-sigma factor
MEGRSLRLENDMAELARLAAAIDETCAGVPADVVGHIQLAAEELVTNVLTHGQSTKGLRVDLGLEAGRFTMRFTDWGRPFDPWDRADPEVDGPVEERAIGGLGVLLVKKLMDELHYRHVGRRNVVEVVKVWSATAEGVVGGGRRKMMEIAQEKSGEVLVVAFVGRLDAAGARPAEARLLEAIEAGERRLVLDLQGLEYVSSVGLRSLMTAAKRMKAVDGKIVVCALKPVIEQVFEIAGFDRLFPRYASRAEAVQAQGVAS